MKAEERFFFFDSCSLVLLGNEISFCCYRKVFYRIALRKKKNRERRQDKEKKKTSLGSLLREMTKRKNKLDIQKNIESEMFRGRNRLVSWGRIV